MFEVGETIICVDDSIKGEMLFAVIDLYVNWVKKGEHYTVREILYNDNIVTGILLEEIHNPIIFIKLLNREQEPAFGTFRFVKSATNKMEEEYESEFSILEREILEN